MRNRRLLLLACSTAVAAAFAACSVYDSSLLVPGDANLGGSAGDGGDAQAGSGGTGGTAGDGSAGGAGTAGDGGAGAGGDSGPVCNHATYPQPPSGSTGGSTGGDFFVAMRTVSFGDPSAVKAGLPAYQSIGFDLDNLCSDDIVTGPWSCKEPSWANADHKDGIDGRDDAVGALVTAIQTYLPSFGSASYNQLIADGHTSILVRIQGYNGQPDDAQVRASLFIAAPYDSIDPGAGTPKWDGTDTWPIASDSLTDDANGNIDKARYVDENAYVSGGKLVASLTHAGLRLSAGLLGPGANSGDINMNLVGAFLSGDLVQVQTSLGTQWQVDHVMLAGRWPADDIVQQMSQFPNPNDGLKSPLCMDSAPYGFFRDLVCAFTDIYSSIGTPSVPCDSLSFGIYLETTPALPGDIYTILPAAPRCADAVDPKHDSCAGPHPSLTDAGPDASDAGAGDSGGDSGATDDAAADAADDAADDADLDAAAD